MARTISNLELAKILAEIGEYLAMREDSVFKIRAYERAAQSISELNEEVAALYKKGGRKALEDIPSVGFSIAEKIEELLTTGALKYYEKLKKQMPVNLAELSLVEGLGPKGIRKLYRELAITNLAELQTAAEEGKIKALEGFGEKSEEKILRSIAFVKKSGGRFTLGEALPQARAIEKKMRALSVVKQVVVAGSARRRKETIGDVDVLVTSSKPEAVTNAFVHISGVVEVRARGATRSAVKFANGLNADLRVVPEKSYGAALNYFTGSKEHNVALRQIAIDKGYKLNEYGLFKGTKFIAGRTEKELYAALGLVYIEPELRENAGEIEAASTGTLPKLIGYNDLKGDLQVQTNWSDGTASIEEMARAAMTAGLEYMLVTDHTKRLAMTGGLDEKKLRAQMAEVDEVHLKIKDQKSKFKILKGTECDILKNGTLDLPNRVLAELDVVGVAVHSHFNLPRAEQTKRIIAAMRNPNVDILFHPTGRIINRRPAYELDMEEIIAVAKETGTVLEIDAYPDRLDLRDEHIRQCVAAGVKLSIDSDAHSPDHFSVLEYGIAQARRGWAEKKDIINAWPLEKMLSFLKDRKE